MATAKEYAAWIVANQSKRGTPQFDTVASAYAKAKANESAAPEAAVAPSAAPEQPKRSALLQSAADVFGGAIRGAGSIGATALRPFETGAENAQRRRDIDEGLQNLLGSDPESLMYASGKLAGEVAGTAGLGPLMAGGARAVPVLARFAPALETGGLAPQMQRGVTNMLTRAGAGAATGGAATLAADPSQTAAGAGFGAAFGLGAPVVNALGRLVGKVAEQGYRGSKATA